LIFIIVIKQQGEKQHLGNLLQDIPRHKSLIATAAMNYIRMQQKKTGQMKGIKYNAIRNW